MRKGKQMKFGLLGLTIVLCLTLLVTACSNSGNSDETNGDGGKNESSGSKPIHVSFWAQGGGYGEFAKEMVKKFNQEHDDIQVDITIQRGEYLQTLTLGFQSKQAPDVFEVISTPKIVQHGWLEPLNELVNKELLENLQPYFKKGITEKDGKIYALPTNAVTVRLIYNKDLFKKVGLDPNAPPKTFSEVKEYAKKITEASDGKAYGFGLQMKWGGFTDWQVDRLALAYQPNLTGKGAFNMKTGEFETGKYKDTIQLYRTMLENGWVYPGASSLNLDALRSAFSTGKVGMYISANWDTAVLNNQLKTKVNWAAARLPVPDGEKFVQMPGNAGRVYGISSQSKHKKAAGKFLSYITGDEVIKEAQKRGLAYSLLLIGGNGEKYTPEDIEQYDDFLPTDKFTVATPQPGPFLKVQGKGYQETILELILTDKPIEPTLKKVSEKYTKAYKQAVKNGEIDPETFEK